MCIHVAKKIGKHSVLILNDIQNYQNRTYHTPPPPKVYDIYDSGNFVVITNFKLRF